MRSCPACLKLCILASIVLVSSRNLHAGREHLCSKPLMLEGERGISMRVCMVGPYLVCKVSDEGVIDLSLRGGLARFQQPHREAQDAQYAEE